MAYSPNTVGGLKKLWLASVLVLLDSSLARLGKMDMTGSIKNMTAGIISHA
jgi:hypothetical protein